MLFSESSITCAMRDLFPFLREGAIPFITHPIYHSLGFHEQAKSAFLCEGKQLL
jgi:hypothetical protein